MPSELGPCVLKLCLMRVMKTKLHLSCWIPNFSLVHFQLGRLFPFCRMLSSNHKGTEQYENPFAASSEAQDIFSNTTYVEPDIDLTGQSTSKPASTQYENPFANVSGSIGSTTRPSTSQRQTVIATYSGEDTLDEPVSATIVSENTMFYRDMCPF